MSRLTSSARGEAFNPLTWPFLFATFAYGVGFLFFSIFGGASSSSLYLAMAGIGAALPIIWGAIAVLTIVGGLTFLLFNIPPFGKVSGLVGFMLWLFAGFCYVLSGAWLPLVSVTVPNMFFWIWQYLSLTRFREEDARDLRTMLRYHRGGYDDKENPKDAKIDREDNRGVDRQD